MSRTMLSTLLFAAVASAVAIPEPTPVAAPDATVPDVTPPHVTRAPIMFDGDRSYYALDRRNIISDIASGADKVAKSWGSVL